MSRLLGASATTGSVNKTGTGRALHEAMVFDNFSNSSPLALVRVKLLANADFDLCEGEIRDTRAQHG